MQIPSPQNYGGMRTGGGIDPFSTGVPSNNYQYDALMKRASNYIGTNGKRSLDEFFYPYDCYNGRSLEDWEFILMFPVL